MNEEADGRGWGVRYLGATHGALFDSPPLVFASHCLATSHVSRAFRGKGGTCVHTKAFDLRVRTKDFALRIVRMFCRLPKSTEAQVLGKQVLRSGTSVGANYREAYRGRSKAEFVSKCGEVLRELEETGYWLELLADGRIVPPEQLADLRQECHELTAIFVTIVRRAKSPAREQAAG